MNGPCSVDINIAPKHEHIWVARDGTAWEFAIMHLCVAPESRHAAHVFVPILVNDRDPLYAPAPPRD